MKTWHTSSRLTDGNSFSGPVNNRSRISRLPSSKNFAGLSWISDFWRLDHFFLAAPWSIGFYDEPVAKCVIWSSVGKRSSNYRLRQSWMSRRVCRRRDEKTSSAQLAIITALESYSDEVVPCEEIQFSFYSLDQKTKTLHSWSYYWMKDQWRAGSKYVLIRLLCAQDSKFFSP